ncbi:MAG: YfhO family protein [Acutalibacteraceae bacterium]
MQKSILSKPNGKYLFWGAIFGAIIGIIAFFPILIQNNGQYMEYGDYFTQYVPFIKELKRMVTSGTLSWSWNSFLGDSFVGAYSYYTVFNPFAWLVVLFPTKYILYGTMFATILKLSISMISSMLYIRCFCKNDNYAMIGALLYTFSGFTLVNNFFYFFLDVIAVFPFLMFGLEQLMAERKRTVYILSLVLNAAINFYFFVSTVLIVIIYVVFRLELYKISSWKKHGKVFSNIALCSIIGAGIAGLALVPSFYAILGSEKAMESIGTQLSLMYYPQNILERLRTFVAPIESGYYHAFYDGTSWSSTGIYLPVFGCTLVLQWCVKKHDWLKKTCIFLTVCYFIPILNAVFSLFSSCYYTRWLYGLVLLFSLSTVRTLEEIDESKQIFNKKLLFVISTFTAVLLLVPSVIYYLKKMGISLDNIFASACNSEYFMGYSSIVVMIVLTALNYVGLWYIFTTQKFKIKKICSIVMVFCVLNYCVYNVINYDLHNEYYNNDYYYQKSLIEGTENTDLDFEYRIDYPEQIVNYGLFKNKPSVNNYNSLQNPKSSRFAEAVGIGDNIKDTILVTPVFGGEYTDALLSVKYYYDYDGNTEIPEGFKYIRTENSVDIYENENYIPMGFVYESYCTEDQLTDMNPEERAKTMLQTLVVNKEDENRINKYLLHESDVDNEKDMASVVSKRNEKTCSYFKGTSEGFEAEIELESDNIVFFSIPNDEGWEVTVNEKDVKTIDVNYGLMGICCEKGSNMISATYHTRGLTLGFTLSLAFIAIWIITELIIRKRNKTVKKESDVSSDIG